MTHTLNADPSQARTARLDSAGVTLEARRILVRGSKTTAPLQDISLYLPPRSLVALAGPDGSGKTTLLEVLAALRPPDSGQILLDAASLYAYRKSFLPWIGYVSTRNTLHPTLTILENLQTAARLRLPRGTSSAFRQQRVDEILALTGLEAQRDLRVTALNALDRYLAHIAVELVTAPFLLLVDQPDQPLDPGAVHSALEVFQNLTSLGLTVIFVTQSTSAMQAATRLALLDKGGYLVWFGPPQEAPEFIGVPVDPAAAEGPQPALEDIFTFLNSHSPASPKERADRYKAFPAYSKYVDDPISGKRRDLMLDEHPLTRIRGSAQEPQPPPPVSSSSTISQYFTLLSRNLRLFFRDRPTLLLALAAPLALALGLFLLADPGMYQVVGGDATRLNLVLALLSFLVIALASFAFVRSIAAESVPLERERQHNLRTLPYALSKYTLVVPVAIFQGLLLALAYAVATQFQGGIPAFLGFFITLVLAALLGGGLGLVASALAGPTSPQTAIVWALALLLPQLLFSGVVVPLQRQGLVANTLSAAMPARYAFESLVAASGYGSDVAQDSACWALPAAQRLSLTAAQKQNCTCMGDNVLQRCNFPGVRTVVTSLLDQPEPVQPTPDEGVNQLPVQPLLRPGETLQQFSDEVNQYTLKLETYQGIVGSYLSSLQQYLEAATNWQRLQSYAIGNAESRIADQIDRYGPIYNIDLGAHWLILLATSLVLFVLLTVIQIGKGRA